MPWKENWFFVGVDPATRVAISFHWSMRPQSDEGIFTAKFAIDGEEFRHVGRSPIPRDMTTLHPVADANLSLEIVELGQQYRVRFSNDEIDADVRYTGRFETFDFGEGYVNPGQSILGEAARTVYPFNHQEQGLDVDGVVTIKRPGSERTIKIGGWASRDHSWGFRDDHTFVSHHWICASFEDRFVQGTAMHERSYDSGMKFGGFVSSAAGIDPTVELDLSEIYWTEDDSAPLPPITTDVNYVITTASGERIPIIARVSADYGRLDLHFRNKERTEAYEDRLIYCDFIQPLTGQVGAGVLELGKVLRGADAVAQLRRPEAVAR